MALMNSFVLHFKPWLIALLALTGIEVWYYSANKSPRISWNSFFDINFAEEESVQRLFAGRKLTSFNDYRVDIVQVGDSSGLHGVMPKVVMGSLPGYHYLNLGVATNLGYIGYYNMARVALREHPSIRYLVLYTTPIGPVPRKMLWDDTHALMSENIYNEFLRPLRHLIQYPTLQARQDILGRTYYCNYWMKAKENLLCSNRGYLAFDAIFRQSFGWTRETDVEGDVSNDVFEFFKSSGKANEPAAVKTLRNAPRVTDEKFFDWWTLSEKSYFDHVYDTFADLAQEHGVKLILIFNPVPNGIKIKDPILQKLMDWEAIDKGLQRLRERHPEVVVTPFDFWPDDRFSVFSHVATHAAELSSQRVADLLKPILPPKELPIAERTLANPLSKLPQTIDFGKPHTGYGFVDANKLTVAFPMRHMRGKEALIYADVLPGPKPVKLTVTFEPDQQKGDLEEILVECNGTQLHRDSGLQQENSYTWEIPPTVVGRYLGWLIFRFRRAQEARMVAFSKLELSN